MDPKSRQYQTLSDVSINTVRVLGDDSFGSGFFFRPEYCLTCHHVICGMDAIKVEHNKDLFSAEWSKDYSDMEQDIAVLKVPGINITPLLCAKETTPKIKVSVYGFTKARKKSFPLGQEITGTLNTIPIPYEPVEQKTKLTETKPWKKKPQVKVDVYQIETTYAGIGLSGSPVWEENRGKVVGMFVAVSGPDPFRDQVNMGYLLPIETILDRFKPENEMSSNVTSMFKDHNSFLTGFNRGDELFKKENYKTAIEEYNLIIRDPIFVSAINNKGKSLSNLGHYDEAIGWFNMALELNCDYSTEAVIWNNKGYAFYELNKHREAIKCFDRALGIRKDYEFAWTGRGESFYDVGDYTEALRCFKQALAINENYYRAWSRKGDSLKALGNEKEANACYDRADEVAPDNANGWNNRGFNFNQRGQFKEAIACFDRALEINANHTRALVNKGYALNHLGEFDKAIAYFDQVLKINDNEADAWYHKHVALKALNNADEAQNCYEKVFKINPQYQVPTEYGL